MLMLFAKAVGLFVGDTNGDAARNGPVDLSRHGSCAWSPRFVGKSFWSMGVKLREVPTFKKPCHSFDRRGHRGCNTPARLRKKKIRRGAFY